MISKENAIRWVSELRSGKYKQAYKQLQTDANSYCCLGVACVLYAPKYRKNEYGQLDGVMPKIEFGAPKWLANVSNDFKQRTKEELFDLNDNGVWLMETRTGMDGLTFDEIADMIEIVYVYGRGHFPKIKD